MPMTHTETIEAIHAHLDEHPTDWQARRELADLLEDAGRLDEARYQRWAVQWERAPDYDPDFRFDAKNHWYWWGRDYGGVPSGIGAMVRLLEPVNYNQGGYHTRQIAERELMRVLIKRGWPDYRPLYWHGE